MDSEIHAWKKEPINEWIDKGLPVTNVPIDCNIIKIPFESMVSLEVDDVVKEKIAAYETASRATMSVLDPGIVRILDTCSEPRGKIETMIMVSTLSTTRNEFKSVAG